MSSALIPKGFNKFVNVGYNGTPVFDGAKSRREVAEINKNVNLGSNSYLLSLTVLQITRQKRAGLSKLLQCENIAICGAL
jgi:hypothetical protein